MESKEHLENWILNFLSKPHAVFGGLPPCPFAKKAYLSNRVQFIQADDYVGAAHECMHNWSDQVEVVVIVAPDLVPLDSFADQTKELNEIYNQKDFVILEDHKERIEQVQDVILNNGKYHILLIQRSTALNQATQSLHNTDYYKNWSEEYYNEVVAWRNNE